LDYNTSVVLSQDGPFEGSEDDQFGPPPPDAVGSSDTSLDLSGISVLDSGKERAGVGLSREDWRAQNMEDRQNLAKLLHDYADCVEADSEEASFDLGLDLDILRKKAGHLNDCGADYISVNCHECSTDNVAVLSQHCKLRSCRECASKRKREWLGKHLPNLEGIPWWQLRHLTLTLRNQDDVKGGIRRLMRCFKTLRLKHYKDRMKGGLVGYEAHVGVNPETGKWNVHCHVIVHGGYIDQEELSQKWQSITGDSMIVHIRRISKKGYFCQRRGRVIKSHESALEYLLKYVTKGVGLDNNTMPVAVDLETDSWSLDDWEDNTQFGSLDGKRRKVINMARDAKSIGKWSIPALAVFLCQLHKVRLLQAFGSFIGCANLHKEVYTCPKCDSEMIALFRASNHEPFYDAYEKYGVYKNMREVQQRWPSDQYGPTWTAQEDLL